MKSLIKPFGLYITLMLTACSSDNEPKQCACDDLNATTEELLLEIKQTHDVPALAGLLWRQGELKASSQVGVRDAADSTEVGANDLWHLGSITKSMTATLTARLVEQGLINWQDRLGDLIAPEVLTVPDKFKNVTIAQLLSHRAGLLSEINELPTWSGYFHDEREITQQRLSMSRDILQASTGNVGSFRYTNAGYVLVGSVLEQLTGESWEALIEQHVFEPLAINDAGFGAPGKQFPDRLSHPLGHVIQSGQLAPVQADNVASDNPPAMGPAGTLHMSLQSLLRYAQAHLAGAKGESDFLTKQNFDKLHLPSFGGNYALGWYTDDNVISHMGTNTMWYAKLGINYQASLIAIAVTNVGGERGDAATDDVINQLVKRHQ